VLEVVVVVVVAVVGVLAPAQPLMGWPSATRRKGVPVPPVLVVATRIGATSSLQEAAAAMQSRFREQLLQVGVPAAGVCSQPTRSWLDTVLLQD
jgi:hypothetical protein